MYRLISILSLIIRQFILPNPFESFAGQDITFFGLKLVIEPLLANWIAEAILFPVSFFIAGLFYKREMKMPALGSFLYFVFYCLHTLFLYAFCKFSFSIIPCAIISLVYIATLIFIKQKLRGLRFKSAMY